MARLSKTKKWYKDYYMRFGKDRNNVLNNKGVFFQSIATKRSFIKSLSQIKLDSSSNILDIGCGGAWDLIDLIKYGFNQQNLYGVDINDDCISRAKTDFPLLNLSCQDATRLSFQDNFFDLVFESTMFVTLTDTLMSKEIAEEMIRVTKKNGFILLIDWKYGKFWSENYLACNKKRVKSMFNVGKDMEIISVNRGSLIPPVGRFFSTYLGSLYFLVSKLFPFLVGQVTYVLQKK